MQVIGTDRAMVAPGTVRIWTGPRFARAEGVWRPLADLVTVREVPTGWSFSAGGKTGNLLCDQPVELAAATISKVTTSEVFGPTIDGTKLSTGILTFRVVLPAGAKETPFGWEIANIDGVSLGLGLGDWKALGPMTVDKGVVTLDLTAAKAKAAQIDLDPVTVLTPSGSKTVEDQATEMSWASERALRNGAQTGTGALRTGVGFLGMPYVIARTCIAFASCPSGATAAKFYIYRASGALAGVDNCVASVAHWDDLTVVDHSTQGTPPSDLGHCYDGYAADANKGILVDEGAGTWFSRQLNIAEYVQGGTTNLTVCNQQYDVGNVSPVIGASYCVFTRTGANQPHLDVTIPAGLATSRSSIGRLGIGVGL